MENSKTCSCATCGFEWPRGQNGSHSCVSVLRAKLDALEKNQFVVVAGKYESPMAPDDDGRNYKFSGEPKSSLTEAVAELMTVSDYPFSEIEFTDANGKHWILDVHENTNACLPDTPEDPAESEAVTYALYSYDQKGYWHRTKHMWTQWRDGECEFHSPNQAHNKAGEFYKQDASHQLQVLATGQRP